MTGGKILFNSYIKVSAAASQLDNATYWRQHPGCLLEEEKRFAQDLQQRLREDAIKKKKKCSRTTRIHSTPRPQWFKTTSTSQKKIVILSGSEGFTLSGQTSNKKLFFVRLRASKTLAIDTKIMTIDPKMMMIDLKIRILNAGLGIAWNREGLYWHFGF